MYTTKLLFRGIVTVGLVAVLSGYGLAAGPRHEQMSDQPYEWGRGQQSYSSVMDTNMQKASKLIGSPVRNPQGQRLGTIYDLVLTDNLGHVSYIALSRGGFLGIGRNLYAIPWSELQVGATGGYILPVSQQEFTQWRGFRQSAWPEEAAQSWTSERNAGTGRMISHETAQEKRSIQDRRVSRIMGTIVVTPEDQSAGKIDDMIIALDSGNVQYSIVAFGGFLGLGQRFAAVPESAITVQPGQRLARLGVGRSVLRENSFAAGQFPDLGNPSYARNIDQAYGVSGAGQTVLGYVPPEKPATESTKPGMSVATERETPAVGRTRALTINPEAKFDPAAVETVKGTVTMVGKFAGAEKGSEMLLLQIRTDAGNLVTVQAGPLNYVSKQDFYAVDGDHVTVTGAPVAGSEGSQMLAARIVNDNGQELSLRNREGQPLWEHLSQGGQERTGETAGTPEKNMEESSGQGASHNMNEETPTP